MTTVLFSDIPPKTLLALDLISLTTSPAFHGIRNVPPGVHFVFTGTNAGLAIRHGLWFVVPPYDGNEKKELCFRWYPEEERLIQVREESQTAIGRPEEMGLRDQLGGGLVDYSAKGTLTESHEDAMVDWRAITSYIATEVLSRILSVQQSSVLASPQPGAPTWTITSVSSSPQDVEAEIPGIDPTAFTKKPKFPSASPTETPESETLDLLPIDLKRTWREGAIGRERTEAAQDRSWALGDLIDRASSYTTSSPTTPTTETAKNRERGAKHLLAELQFTFLMVLLLGNYSCLEQWKRLTSLLFTCKRAVAEVEGFFVLVLKVLEMQVRCLGEVGGIMENGGGMVEEIREEFAQGGLGMGMGMGGGGAGGGTQGRMRKLIEGWRKEVEDIVSSQSELRGEIKRLWGLMREEFGW